MIVSNMSQGESETEHERKVRKFWAKKFSIYDIGSTNFKDDNDDRLPYEPTAVLVSKRQLRINQQESFRFMT